ncbi:GntR family transcriptional regulator [Paenibacillus baekrokdamisoli]|uniref:GntR family transcriptional regulator n=1 Tax=Paenibacillus baekrokdamisoli TaxID=1712516 RepID=A0A3G9ISG6_9BACL|nr:FadR/GntR family transcriptional regulator [Paenibacillus baekrokdamisoli]MBB3072640.1 DNA-binding FadR family transcriptional regulator [Paenibacillus baekrokdamisoli]BBH18925.1 GntR family transcriptional regulator [Paenibacillus baekrokdamisoli]
MEVTRLTKRNHYEEIAEQIKLLITDGKLKVGDKLPSTKEMSEQFGVGRSTTREALSALKAMGWIEIRQGGGCRVISSAPVDIALPELQALRSNRETLLELLEVRQSLEVSNVAIAAEKRTEADVAALNALILEMERSIGDDLEGERTDLLFHLTLAKATHNSIMVRLFESITSQMEMAIREIRRAELYANRSVSEQLYEEHSAIFQAIVNQDASLASDKMKQHLQHVESILMKYV